MNLFIKIFLRHNHIFQHENTDISVALVAALMQH